jgi:5-enolpyruvylshikimate-3-phosphate synthase
MSTGRVPTVIPLLVRNSSATARAFAAIAALKSGSSTVPGAHSMDSRIPAASAMRSLSIRHFACAHFRISRTEEGALSRALSR